jgi:hypothetical protein
MQFDTLVGSSKCKWNDAARSETKRGALPAGVAAAEGLIERTAKE